MVIYQPDKRWRDEQWIKYFIYMKKGDHLEKDKKKCDFGDFRKHSVYSVKFSLQASALFLHVISIFGGSVDTKSTNI
jgi:hypothetical protein